VAKLSKSWVVKIVNWPAVIVDGAGQRHWGLVQQGFLATRSFQQTWSMRDQLTVKHTPACITVVEVEGGAMLWQNPASAATFGELIWAGHDNTRSLGASDVCYQHTAMHVGQKS
jgi:hypothetical protein